MYVLLFLDLTLPIVSTQQTWLVAGGLCDTAQTLNFLASNQLTLAILKTMSVLFLFSQAKFQLHNPVPCDNESK